jgi:hypothetical protein
MKARSISNKRSQPWDPKWEEDFGFAAATYPVVAAEFGGAQEAPPRTTRTAYGPASIHIWKAKGSAGWYGVSIRSGARCSFVIGNTRFLLQAILPKK